MTVTDAMTVWKFPFSIEDDFIVQMPIGARVIHVEVQHGQPCLWAVVNPRAQLVDRWFYLLGTGHPFAVEIACRHVGSFLMAGGDLVWHVFEPEGA